MAKKNNTGAKVGVGVGVAAAAAAAAAGAYWLYGAKDAAKHRKQVKGWMLKARAEVMENVEKLSEVDKEKYLAIVDGVVKRYAGAAGVTAAELSQMARDLKASWVHMQMAGTKGKSAVKRGTKVAKKAKKKVSKKK